MHERYRDLDIEAIFDPATKIQLWAQFELAFVQARVAHGQGTEADVHKIAQATIPTLTEIDEAERDTGHDVVAFLAAWLSKIPEESRYLVHQGLTSSDLVDYSLMYQMAHSLSRVASLVDEFTVIFMKQDEQYGNIPRIGRTHGQYAEPTTWQNRTRVWSAACASAFSRAKVLINEFNSIKAPGATGNSWHFSPNELQFVVQALEIGGIVPGTQIRHRSLMLAWAGLMLEFVTIAEDITTEIRLSARSEVAELFEATGGRVGSSSMPGKKNPILCEKVAGMARLARGYHATIAQNVVLHHDRDISNSSVERVAIEDLAHVVAHACRVTVDVLTNMTFNEPQMSTTLSDNEHRAMASTLQYLLQQEYQLSPLLASGHVRRWLEEDKPANPEDYAALLEGLDDPDGSRAQAVYARIATTAAQMGF